MEAKSKQGATKTEESKILKSIGKVSVDLMPIPVVITGRLTNFLPQWQEITNVPVILSYITGYHIEFDIEKPIDYSKSKSIYKPLVLAQEQFFEQEIAKLLIKGVLEQVPEHSPFEFISSVFFRPKPDGTSRMILNLRNLNESVKYYHFKMDTLQSAMKLVEPNSYMASIDLKDAYYSVAISKCSRKYLRFLYKNTLYQYTCLPNGLASAPRVFTKLLKPVLSELRRMGISCLSYIDDVFIQAKAQSQCILAVKQAVTLFQRLGFIIHPEKSVLEPKTSLVFFRISPGFHKYGCSS